VGDLVWDDADRAWTDLVVPLARDSNADNVISILSSLGRGASTLAATDEE